MTPDSKAPTLTADADAAREIAREALRGAEDRGGVRCVLVRDTRLQLVAGAGLPVRGVRRSRRHLPGAGGQRPLRDPGERRRRSQTFERGTRAWRSASITVAGRSIGSNTRTLLPRSRHVASGHDRGRRPGDPFPSGLRPRRGLGDGGTRHLRMVARRAYAALRHR